MTPALVCISTYNERDNLAGIVQAVLAADARTEVLVVDDNSPDRTGDLADALAAREPRVHVLHRERKEGLGRAYLAAFAWALQRPYAFVLERDADWSHPPRSLPELLNRAEAGADLVLGSLYARTVLGLRVRDLTGGFKCFRRRVLESIDLAAVHSTGYAFQIELTYRAVQNGFRVEEMPIVFEDRRVGQSKMSRRIVVEALTMVWKLRFTVPRP